MSNFPFRRPNFTDAKMTTASIVQDQCHGLLFQLVLELKPERGVDGALGDIADEADLPFSKVRRIYYKLTKNICAWERDRLETAIVEIATKLEPTIERRLESIRSLRDERRLLERQIDLRV